MMQDALTETYNAIREAPVAKRQDVPLSHLKIGVKCGASDGFSGISANPAMGEVSDRLCRPRRRVGAGGIPRAVRR